MIRSILGLITYLISDFKFLGFYGGFWFLSVPLITLVICAEKSKCEKDKLNAAEDFDDVEDVEELPLHSIEFKVNSTEKWQIGQVLKRLKYDSVDDLLRSVLDDIIS